MISWEFCPVFFVSSNTLQSFRKNIIYIIALWNINQFTYLSSIQDLVFNTKSVVIISVIGPHGQVIGCICGKGY